MDASLGLRLRTLREQRSLNQIDVAEAVGISRTHLTKIEGDEGRPGRETLMALATFFGVSLDWLATGHGQIKMAQASAQNEREALLLMAFRLLPEEEASPLLQMLVNRTKPKQSS